MDENKLPQEQSGDRWLDDLLPSPEIKDEIGVDEHAVSSAGLTHPSDLELEKIMQEVLSEVQAEKDAAQNAVPARPEPVPAAAEPETFKDDEFRAAFGEGESLNRIFSDEPMPPAPAEDPIPAPAEESEEEQPVEKGRPKRKKATACLACLIWPPPSSGWASL